MDARELRIGNLAQDQYNNILVCCELNKISIGFEVLDRSKFPLKPGWKSEPIPLTEEWLLKFGFEKKGKRFSKDWFYLWDECGSIVFALAEMHDEVGTYLPIQHVHQLQNLYFALTGKELTI